VVVYKQRFIPKTVDKWKMKEGVSGSIAGTNKSMDLGTLGEVS
jgi:hypothetical protein